MKVSNWAVAAITLAILIGCAGGGTLTTVQHPGLRQTIADVPQDNFGGIPEGTAPIVGDGPLVDTGSVDHAGLLAFPGSGSDVFSPIHKVSEVGFQTDGTGYVDSFGPNNRAGAVEGEYVLIPEGGGIAWALYSIPGLTGDRPVRVEFAVTPAELEPGSGEDLRLSYWIGVADYTLYHWDWHGPFTGPQEVVINSAELKDRYVSEVGTLHWVAVLYGDEEAGLPGITLQNGTVVVDSDYYANKPHYTAIDTIEVGSGGSGGGKGASGTGGTGFQPVNYGGGEDDRQDAYPTTKSTSELDPNQYIVVDWSHIQAFNIFDQQNEAIIYRVYRLGPGDFGPVYIADRAPSITNYTDPADIGEGHAEPRPGATYKYFVQAINLNGFTPLSSPIGATVPIFPPLDVVAALDESADYTEVTWEGIEGVKGYQVWREEAGSGTTEQIAFVPMGTERYEDSSAVPGVYFLYSVKSVGEGAKFFDDDDVISSPSSTVQGLRSVVLALSCVEIPAPAGLGILGDPFIIFNGEEYQFNALDQEGNDLTDEVEWEVDPPALARFDVVTSGLLTDIWEHAGNFKINAMFVLDLTYTWQTETYYKVEMTQS